MKNSTYIQKKWMHFKVSTLSASVTALVLAGIPNASTASDIDIYQAGGTGGVNVLLMLDHSASMGSMSLGNDYGEEFNVTMVTEYCNVSSSPIYNGKFERKNTGFNYNVTFTNSGGVSGKHYTRSGNSNSNYVYTFVGVDKGRYKINTITASTSNSVSNNNRFFFSGNVVNRNECFNESSLKKISYCSNNNAKLNKNLSIVWNSGNSSVGTKTYTYHKSGENYCEIDLNPLRPFSAQNVDIKNYIKKIETICEASGENDVYNCLTRIANLRKGLINVITSDSITDETRLGLGQYPDGTQLKRYNYVDTYGGSRVHSIGDLGTMVKMDAIGKNKIIEVLLGLNLYNGTPIYNAYKTAQNYYNNVEDAGVNKSCHGNGLYFLTDGVPQYDDHVTPTGNVAIQSPFTTSYWSRIAPMARALRETGKKALTASVGFGATYYVEDVVSSKGEVDCTKFGAVNSEERQFCQLGEKNSGVGNGGFYTAQSSTDLIDSILNFVNDVSVPIEGSTMGTSTIPVDALNTTQLQPYSYFPMFKPLINTDDQLWAGNLKKFKVDTTTGTIIDKKNNTVFDADNIRASLEDYWYESGGSSNDDTKMAWGGLLSKLKVHHTPTLVNGNVAFQRELYINQSGQLKKVTEVLNSTSKPTNSQYLYGLLGYSKLTADDFTQLSTGSYSDQLNYLKNKAASQNYQMGSVIHSTPIMLTQEGSFGYDGDNYVSKGRKDYILAGTTQGLVQVVDAESGKEVFSFLPSEFLNGASNQAKGFAESLAMDRRVDTSKDQFFYGVDGPWVAHTEYKNKFDVTTDVVTNESIEVESLVASKQYVYGGLRMGGKSYYGLDLTKLGNNSGEKPSMLFHIDPANAGVGTPLSYMGQSWSKPTVTYIRWNGQKKLAMIVGGGYDPKYEDPAFVNNASVEGNGIYIFDALNGDLLWWGSSKATDVSQPSITNNRVTKPESNLVSTMKNSIPSSIKAIDRDGDGITDHLYTGDLGGQVFRVDLNPEHKVSTESSDQKPLVLNAVKLADVNEEGKNPRRFYEPPTFTIHKDGGKRFAVLAMSSGDRSSPLVTDENAPKDIVVAIEDHDVTKTPVIVSNTVNLSDLHNLSGETGRRTTAKGWYYLTEIESKKLRGFEPGIALDNDLYFSLFNPDKTTADTDNVTSCTGGITGESIAYKFCLPYGICSATVKGPEKVGSLGPGILGLTLGPGRTSATNRTLIFNKETSPVPPEYTVTDKLVPRRWFEYLPYKSGN